MARSVLNCSPTCARFRLMRRTENPTTIFLSRVKAFLTASSFPNLSARTTVDASSHAFIGLHRKGSQWLTCQGLLPPKSRPALSACPKAHLPNFGSTGMGRSTASWDAGWCIGQPTWSSGFNLAQPAIRQMPIRAS